MRKIIFGLIATLIMTPAAVSASTLETNNVEKANYSVDDHGKKDIVDTAVSAKVFSTLVAAVKAADLVDVLKSKGKFTVFAPTDKAFAKLPKGTIAKLLKPENKKLLVKILTYHVVAGDVMAKDVVKLSSAKTVQGQSIGIEVKDGKVYLNGKTKVVKTDIGATNGRIHVIDTVLMPPM